MRTAGEPPAGQLRTDYRAVRSALSSGRAGERAVNVFRETVHRFYSVWGRDFPWRRTRDPYRILVSEFMLQQTQVQRVQVKYDEFLRRFPDLRALSAAPLSEVLACWQGLGYNRRAKALRDSASRIMADFGGKVPSREDLLVSLPGVGKATAGAVRAFSFGLPAVFIETNIRRVYLHFFFPRGRAVTDRKLLSLVGLTLDESDPRTWYYALMDYGVFLKGSPADPNRRSAHYRRQSPFEGSDRQIRSMALRCLLQAGPMPEEELIGMLGGEEERARRMIAALVDEGFAVRRGGALSIA